MQAKQTKYGSIHKLRLQAKGRGTWVSQMYTFQTTRKMQGLHMYSKTITLHNSYLVKVTIFDKGKGAWVKFPKNILAHPREGVLG